MFWRDWKAMCTCKGPGGGGVAGEVVVRSEKVSGVRL